LEGFDEMDIYKVDLMGLVAELEYRARSEKDTEIVLLVQSILFILANREFKKREQERAKN
jgi:hypothetical protein